MNNEDKKMNVTAKFKDKDIELSDIIVIMEFEGQTATVDAETAIKRSLHLVYENAILRNAVQEAKRVFEEQNTSKIILPGGN